MLVLLLIFSCATSSTGDIVLASSFNLTDTGITWCNEALGKSTMEAHTRNFTLQSKMIVPVILGNAYCENSVNCDETFKASCGNITFQLKPMGCAPINGNAILFEEMVFRGIANYCQSNVMEISRL